MRPHLPAMMMGCTCGARLTAHESRVESRRDLGLGFGRAHDGPKCSVASLSAAQYRAHHDRMLARSADLS